MAEDQDPREDSGEDQALIARWYEGDERAATRLVTRHVGPLTRYLKSLGSRDGTDELVQDTFVRAFSSLDSFRGESSLRTWLFTIARRLLLDQRRSFKRQRAAVEITEADAVTEYDALHGLIADESAQRVRAAVERLSPTQREVFTLRVAEGLSYRDIAEVVGTTEGAARVHYHNALRVVKEMLNV